MATTLYLGNRGDEKRAEAVRWQGPFDGSVAMAADDEHLGVVPLDRLAEHTPSVPLHRLKHSVAHLQHIRRSKNVVCKQRGLGPKTSWYHASLFLKEK
jgi:hypothetical protein